MEGWEGDGRGCEVDGGEGGARVMGGERRKTVKFLFFLAQFSSKLQRSL